MIVDDICNGNSEPYGAEPLRELLKLLPDTEEVSSVSCRTLHKQVCAVHFTADELQVLDTCKANIFFTS